jgi:hypothetical protein
MPQLTRTLRAIVAIIVACGIAFININSYDGNDVGYQEHPIASILGSSLPAIIVGLIIYFSLGIRRNKLKFSPSIFKTKFTSATEQDDWAFEKASSELEGGNIDKAVWARAYAECRGDENESKAKYISLRVERLKVEKILLEHQAGVNSPDDAESISSRKYNKYAYGVFGLLAIASIILVINYHYSRNHQQELEIRIPIINESERGWEAMESFKEWESQKIACKQDLVSSRFASMNLSQNTENEITKYIRKCNPFTAVGNPDGRQLEYPDPPNWLKLTDLMVESLNKVNFEKLPQPEKLVLVGKVIKQDRDFQTLSHEAQDSYSQLFLLVTGISVTATSYGFKVAINNFTHNDTQR